MLTVYYKNDDRKIGIVGEVKIFYWKINSTNHRPAVNFSQIECVVASGHELNLIYDNFSNLPFVEGCEAIKWFGDHAKFIFANIEHLMVNNKTYPKTRY